jgi:hypothetical protein
LLVCGMGVHAATGVFCWVSAPAAPVSVSSISDKTHRPGAPGTQAGWWGAGRFREITRDARSAAWHGRRGVSRRTSRPASAPLPAGASRKTHDSARRRPGQRAAVVAPSRR